jgi:capsular polysaccharide biosynthesis protein
MEETISLKELFETIRKRLWMIIAITTVAVLVAAIISYFFLTPMYQSSTQVLVNQEKSDTASYNYTDIRTNVEIINTYSVIITSPAILDKVSEEIDGERTPSQIKSAITVRSEGNSQVFSITVIDQDPALAVEIANTTANIFKKDIKNLMSVDNVSVLAQAKLSENPSPVNPNPVLNMAIALVVGLMAGVGLAFLLEYLDNTIKTEQDIEKLLGLPVLGAIAEIDLEKELSSSKSEEVKVGGESIGA